MYLRISIYKRFMTNLFWKIQASKFALFATENSAERIDFYPL